MSNSVTCPKPRQTNRNSTRERERGKNTDHHPARLLRHRPLLDIARNPQGDNTILLVGKFLRVQTADDKEPFSLEKFASKSKESRIKVRKPKRASVDLVDAAEVERLKTSHGTGHFVNLVLREVVHKCGGLAIIITVRLEIIARPN